MVGCSAYGCSNSSVKGHKMFRVPWEKARRMRWAVAINRKKAGGRLWMPGVGARICEMHFVTRMRSDDPSHVDYVPSVFRHDRESETRAERKAKRYERHMRIMHKREAAAAQQHPRLDGEAEVGILGTDYGNTACTDDTSIDDNMGDIALTQAKAVQTDALALCASCSCLQEENEVTISVWIKNAGKQISRQVTGKILQVND
ncbi:uncharacterized protein LOC135395423 isoform X1 [Ornithodoros turicata]|uniref:uncharacterized protein LOC135395423 isoform X1 n=3 Tax=Ornithodoros turicata TaxID=34597 RepID=UPI003139E4CD